MAAEPQQSLDRGRKDRNMKQAERERAVREWMATKDASGRVLIKSVGAGFVRVRPGTKLIDLYSAASSWAGWRPQ
jgi:hypothetical protein